MLKSFCLALAAVLGVAALANGLYMLVAPESWYFAVPGVTTSGPVQSALRAHIGMIFLFLGGAFLVGAAQPQSRMALGGLHRCGYPAMPSSTSGRWQSGSVRPR